MILKPLKGYDVFTHVFKKGSKVKYNSTFGVFCSDKCDLELKDRVADTIYFGVTVSKRIAPKAVMRNRIKRLLRESIRKYFQSHDAIPNYYVFVISWRSVPAHPKLIGFHEVFTQVEDLLNKAEKKFRNDKVNA